MNFDKIMEDIKKLSDEDGVEFSYTDETTKRIFRFTKGNAQVCHIISHTDLAYKGDDWILYEIRKVLCKLYKRAMYNAQ